VTKAIAENLLKKYVRFPKTAVEVKEALQSFERKTGYPGALAAGDCSHFAHWALDVEFPDDYENRKFYHSTVLQAFANADGKCVDLYVGQAGRNNDITVFNRSPLGIAFNKDMLPDGHADKPHRPQIPAFHTNHTTIDDVTIPPHFLLDSIYPHTLHGQVLYPDTQGFNQGLTPPQRSYNWRHKDGRCVIENTFGLTKQRWRMFLHTIEDTQPEIINNGIMAACVLHNFCIDHGDVMVRNPRVAPDYDERPNLINGRPIQHGQCAESALAVRDAIAKHVHVLHPACD